MTLLSVCRLDISGQSYILHPISSFLRLEFLESLQDLVYLKNCLEQESVEVEEVQAQLAWLMLMMKVLKSLVMMMVLA